MLFQSYSENWPKLAQEHKDNLGVVCNEFLGELIDYAWPKRMREPLRRHFLEPHMKALMAKAQHELDLLTQDMSLEVQPYDPEYEERLRSWHAKVSENGATFNEAEEVLEKMLIYYELAAKTFIRNIITQVVERHLLQGMYSIFNSVEVLGFANEVIEAIAAENKETRDRRQTLRVQKKAIEEAKEICASLAMRKELRAVSFPSLNIKCMTNARQYAEDGTSDGEDTSDDEDGNQNQYLTQRTPTIASKPRRDRRPVATETEWTQSVARSPDGLGHHQYQPPVLPSPTQTPTTRAYTPSRVDAPPTPGTPHPTEECYTTSTRAPQQAPPPPPPRPGKVRTAEDNESQSQGHNQGQTYAPTGPPRAAARMSQPSMSLPVEQYETAHAYPNSNSNSSSNPYVPADRDRGEMEARRVGRRVSGRA
jgi:hypothetical protein